MVGNDDKRTFFPFDLIASDPALKQKTRDDPTKKLHKPIDQDITLVSFHTVCSFSGDDAIISWFSKKCKGFVKKSSYFSHLSTR
jgi:hypothetical protein